jgi:TP901 family phage tail tape measure protein
MKIFELWGSVLVEGADKTKKDLDGIDKKGSNVGKSLKNMAKVATVATGAVLGIAGALGGKAVNAAKDFEKGMTNVATLLDGDATPRIKELSEEVQKMQVKTGLASEVLTDGLYQVVSAFGDTADSASLLEIASKGATAGGATVTDAVNLLSAVTKGYGDTSKEAAQKASDLAFLTVKLGQTTFPELAASMGKVVPLAETLNVSQEELYATFATLTGVTGNTAEVSTQYRATLQSIIKPTATMAKAMKEMTDEAISNGLYTGELADEYSKTEQKLKTLQSSMANMTKEEKKYAQVTEAEMLKSLEEMSIQLTHNSLETYGLVETLGELNQFAGGSNVVLGEMYSSVESLTAVMALTGAQSETFSEKLEQMGGSAGSTDEAFKKQTMTFESMMNRLKQVGNTLMVSVGEKLLPVLMDLGEKIGEMLPQAVELLTPLITTAIELFTQLAPTIMQVIPQILNMTKPLIEKLAPILVRLLEKLFPVFIALLEAIMPIIDVLIDVFILLLDDALLPLIDALLPLILEILPIFTTILKALMPILKPIIRILVRLIEMVLPFVIKYFEFLAKNILPIFIKVISLLPGIFEKIADIFDDVFSSMVKGFKWFVNIIIKGVNTLIRGINKLNIKIPKWLGGGEIGFNIREIPLLAEGGEIEKSGMAIVGEAGAELVNMKAGATVTPLNEDNMLGGGGDIFIEKNQFIIREDTDIEKVARELNQLIIRERRGLGKVAFGT